MSILNCEWERRWKLRFCIMTCLSNQVILFESMRMKQSKDKAVWVSINWMILLNILCVSRLKNIPIKQSLITGSISSLICRFKNIPIKKSLISGSILSFILSPYIFLLWIYLRVRSSFIILEIYLSKYVLDADSSLNG